MAKIRLVLRLTKQGRNAAIAAGDDIEYINKGLAAIQAEGLLSPGTQHAMTDLEEEIANRIRTATDKLRQTKESE